MSVRRSIDNTASPKSRPSQHDSYFQDRRPSQLNSRRSSVASSVGGSLPSPSHVAQIPIIETSSNAISTLLQPPIVRTGLLPHTSGVSAPRPSARDIPPVTLSPLPPVDEKLFKNYIQQAGSYELNRGARDDQEKRPSISHRTTDDRRPSQSPTISRSESASILSGRRGSGGRRGAPAVAPLSTIPGVYFEDDFKLENPRTFDVVSERAEVIRNANGTINPGKKALAANAILQEKLSWYMDTVEIHLISSISTASSSFFAALGSLRGLHAEAEESVIRIRSLRGDLQNLDDGMAKGGLRIIAMKRRKANVKKLSQAIQQLEEIVRIMTESEDQVDKGETEEALRGLVHVERLIAGDAEDLPETSRYGRPLSFQGKIIDLRGIKALDGAAADIAYLRRRIGKSFESQFIQILLDDLRSHVDTVPTQSTFMRWDRAANRSRGIHNRTPSEMPAYMHVDGELRANLLLQLKGLARSDSIMTAAVSYREAVLREFKRLIRRHLPSSNDDDADTITSIATSSSTRLSQQEKSSILARNLRALDESDAEEMLRKIYANVGEALRRLGTQVKVLLDITSSLGSPRPNLPLRSPRSPSPTPRTATYNGLLTPVDVSQQLLSPTPHALVRQDEIQQTLDLSSLLGQAVDDAQNQIIRVLKVRSQQTTSSEIPFFLRYRMLNWMFVHECEAISGRAGEGLNAVVNDHIKTFVKDIAEAQKQALVQTMDSDRWDAKDFSEADTTRLEMVLANSTKDNESWTNMSSLWQSEDTETKPAINGTSNGTEEPTTSAKDKARPAILDEEKYLIPASAIAVLEGIEVHEKLLYGIPFMNAEICNYLLDYIKLYNSRSNQLILGAGATRSAGLKNITTRHLALSSQALNFITALIPYVREFARRVSNSSSSLPDFDDTKRRLQEHRLGIQDKLIEIMTGRSTAHVSTMKSIGWNTEIITTNAYMETLIKETMTLHKVLVKHLPESNVRMIMSPVLSNYREQWGKAFQEVSIVSDLAKQNLLRDAEYFKTRMNKIDEFGDIGDFLYGIAESRTIDAEVPSMPASVSSTPVKPKS